MRHPSPPASSPSASQPITLTQEYTNPAIYIDIISPVPPKLLRVQRDEEHEEMIRLMLESGNGEEEPIVKMEVEVNVPPERRRRTGKGRGRLRKRRSRR
ncbi:hypothetical protein BT69DRAFT_26979 [Atractiella rhizophila]|nr:hypothetical protein BT69DRAFT_26979 [Atractiella rhizophila]